MQSRIHSMGSIASVCLVDLKHRRTRIERIAQSALNKIRGDIWKAISSKAFVVMEVVKGNFRQELREWGDN